MKTTDKFLIAILAGVLLLVAVTIGLVLSRPPVTYVDDDTAEHVAQNYLLALSKRDYARAYGYVSPTLNGYPATVDQFVATIQDNHFGFGRDQDTSLQIMSSRPYETPPGTVSVFVREARFSRNRLFGPSEYSLSFEMVLRRENGAWKIQSATNYWLRCWSDIAACK